MTEEKAPMVGSFPVKDENPSRLPRKETESPPVEDDSVDENSDEKDGKKDDTVKDDGPSFEERLKGVGLTVGEARLIMDTILTEGFYEESIPFNAQKNIVLRTRTYTDTLRAQKFLELESPTYPIAINDLIARYNMAASLARFGDKDFRKQAGDTTVEEPDAAFNRRYDFIMSLPTVVVIKLMGLLHKFDMKMQAVFDEGAPEDF